MPAIFRKCVHYILNAKCWSLRFEVQPLFFFLAGYWVSLWCIFHRFVACIMVSVSRDAQNRFMILCSTTQLAQYTQLYLKLECQRLFDNWREKATKSLDRLACIIHFWHNESILFRKIEPITKSNYWFEKVCS